MKPKLWWLAVMALLAACGSAESQATATTVAPTLAAVVQQAEPTSTATVALTATATVSVTGVTTNTDWVNTASVDGDFYVRGNPSAPIRLIDFSDFL